jgi:hypothetical protein
MNLAVYSGMVFWNDQTFPAIATPNYGNLIWYGAGNDLQILGTIAVDPSHATWDRWDIITAKVSQIDDNSTSRDFEDAATRVKSSQTFFKNVTTRLTLKYIPGTASGSPIEPAVPAGEVKIARVIVQAGVTSVGYSDVIDYRKPAGCHRYLVPLSMGRSPAGQWTLNGGMADAWGAAAAGNDWYCDLTVPWATPRNSPQSWLQKHVRIRRIHLLANITAGGLVETWMADYGNWTGRPAALNEAFTLSTYGSLWRHTLTPSDPLWLNGRKHPRDDSAAGNPIEMMLTLRVRANGIGDSVEGLAFEYFGTP